MAATAEQIEECFTIFDTKKQGFLEKEQIGTVLRALGKNPTEKELKEIQNEIGSEKVDIGKLKSLYRSNKLRTPQDQDKEMRDAFKALDKEGNGKVLEAELRQILGNLGDSLSNQEVNSLMRDANVESDGCVDYNKFVDMLVNAFPVGDKLKG